VRSEAVDKEFLEFWGNFLLSVARGQRRMEDMAKWVQQGMSGFDDLGSLFRRAYHLPGEDEGGAADISQAWKRSEEAFRQAFRQYLTIMGMVSLEEYQALQEENARLREQITEQARTIKYLQMLLAYRDEMAPEKLAHNIREIMEQQANAFRKMMTVWSPSDQSD